jgi:hypothetical protein
VISRRRVAFAVAAVIAIAAIVLTPRARPEDEAPLRTEDVVRMLVSGGDPSAIVSEIRSRPVDFDVSEEMLDELRIAGVPPEIIKAMQERHAELHPAEPVAGPRPQVEEFVTDVPLLVIEFDLPVTATDDEREPSPPALYFPGALPAPAAQALQLGDGSEPVEVEGIAIFIACRTAIHVPDYWRSKSPLGRDFVSMPRHRMIAFHGGDARLRRADLPTDAAKRVTRVSDDVGYVRVEIPDLLEAAIDLGEVHDLSFGVAIQVGGRFLRIVSDDRDDFDIGNDAILRVRALNDPTEGGFGIDAVIVTD